MTAEVVHNDDVTWSERRDQMLGNIGPKAFTIDRAVKDIRCCELVATQCPQECHRAPSSMWCKAVQPLTLRAPAAQRRHVGLDPGLVDEHQVVWIEAALPILPASASPNYVAA